MKLFANFRPMKVWELINSVEHPSLSVDGCTHLYPYQRDFLKRMCRKNMHPIIIGMNIKMAIWNIPIKLN